MNEKIRKQMIILAERDIVAMKNKNSGKNRLEVIMKITREE